MDGLGLSALEIEREILEPCGLGHDLLWEWAPWARDDSDGRSSWNVKPRLGRGYWGDPPPNFKIVDKIVAPYRAAKQKLLKEPWEVTEWDRENAYWWEPVAQYYLGLHQPIEIASALGWSELRVCTVLCLFCGQVEREFKDWRDYGRSRSTIS